MLSDFNCKIFNTDRLSLLDPSIDRNLFFERINSDLESLDSFGIHRLFCQVPHNELLCLSQTFSKINTLEKFIKISINRSVRRKFTINVVPSIHLSPNAPFISNISSLTALDSNYIFIDLPISVMYPEYLDSAINKILYNCKLLPVFNEFQDFACIHHGTAALERMIKIKGAAFQFSLNSKNFANYIDIIKQIHDNGNYALLSTSCEHDLFNKTRISGNLNLLRESLPSRVYLNIMLRAHSFLR